MDMAKVDDQNQEVEKVQSGEQKFDDNNPIAMTCNHVSDVISTIGAPSELSTPGPSRRIELRNDVSLQQMFVNGVELPISKAPMFGHVCVKDSTDIQFGNKNVYTDGVTIEQIFHPNLNSTDDKDRKNDERKEETANSDGHDQAYPKDKKLLICGIGSSLLIAVVVCVVVFVLRQDDPPGPNEPRIITRAEWKAQEPLETILLELPVPYVVISHTETDCCFTQSECELRVFDIQTFYLKRCKWADIGYNFLVGGDGNVYEGRGWDYVGAHTLSYNKRSIGISLIGNFSIVKPLDRQLLATQQLIKLGVHKGKLEYNYKLIGHRQNRRSRTDSPGDAAYHIIKKWPHWRYSDDYKPDKYSADECGTSLELDALGF